MPIFYADTASFNNVQVTGSLLVNGSAVGGGFGLIESKSYTTPGTYEWTKPAGAQIVSVILVGGGGGGASGAAAVGSGVAGGTGGGAAGGVVIGTYPAIVFDATESVVVGAGGAGGVAVSRTGAGSNATTAGNSGNVGTDTLFGELDAPGGSSGSYTAANNALGMGGAPNPVGATFITDTALAGYTIPDNYTNLIGLSGPGGCGAATDKSPAAVAALTMSIFVPTGGGFGGTPGNTTTSENGGTGGFSTSSFGSISGGAGGTSSTVSGSDGILVGPWFGTGGGGGFGHYVASGAATGSAGGSGSIGAGGGGGGSARNNTNTAPNTATSGAGGKGGDGAVFVYVYG